MTKKIGRPLKVTKRRTDAFCEAISIGSTNEMAAAYARIDPDTALNWLKRGEDEINRRAKNEAPQESEQPFVDFFGAVRQARLEAGIRWQQVVDAAASKDPNWAYRMLRVRFGADYREPAQPVEVGGRDGGPMEIVIRYAEDGTYTT